MSGEIDRGYLKRSGREASEKRPYLTPDVVPGAPDVLVLTVMHAQAMRKGSAALIEFREYPSHVLWITNRDLVAAADALGDDTARWAGHRFVLEKARRNNPNTGGTVLKYVPAPLDAPEWGPR